jgi:hypothetical protein
MDFQTAAQKDCYEKVVPWLKELFGQFAQPHDEKPVIAVVLGSAMAQVGVYPFGSDGSSITTRAWVVRDVEVGSDLTDYLLHQNDSMRFGAFGLDRDNDVFFEHTILGGTCDKEELNSSVTAVVATADRYDDELVARFGGKRGLDIPGINLPI